MKVVGNSVASFSARNIILLVFDSLCILSVFPYRNEVHLTGQLCRMTFVKRVALDTMAYRK